MISSLFTGAKSNRWQRDKTVIGIFPGSVVQKTNLTWSGGSSSVFNKALNASFVSMCTSSMIYTLNRDRLGRTLTFDLS